MIHIDASTPEKLDALCKAVAGGHNVDSDPVFFTFIHNKKDYDLEAETEYEAEIWAHNWWDEQNEDLPYGEIAEDEGEIVCYSENDERERTFLYRVNIVLIAEGYHGDHEEHFNQSMFI